MWSVGGGKIRYYTFYFINELNFRPQLASANSLSWLMAHKTISLMMVIGLWGFLCGIFDTYTNVLDWPATNL